MSDLLFLYFMESAKCRQALCRRSPRDLDKHTKGELDYGIATFDLSSKEELTPKQVKPTGTRG